jgi:hypothetical protein
MTVFDLLRSSLRLIGAIQPGRAPTGAELVESMFVANSMLDAWSAEQLAVFTSRYDLLSLTANQQSYTIGIDPAGIVTAQYSIPRPVRITDANLLISSTVRRPILPINQTKWAAIRYQTVYAPPRKVYLDGSYASGIANLLFYPIPDQAYQWEQYSWQALAAFAEPTDIVQFPPGYADAIRYNLAVRLAPEWGKTASPDLIELARKSKAVIGSLNSPSIELRTGGDGALLNGGTGGLYNWMDGLVETE